MNSVVQFDLCSSCLNSSLLCSVFVDLTNWLGHVREEVIFHHVSTAEHKMCLLIIHNVGHSADSFPLRCSQSASVTTHRRFLSRCCGLKRIVVVFRQSLTTDEACARLFLRNRPVYVLFLILCRLVTRFAGYRNAFVKRMSSVNLLLFGDIFDCATFACL